jgi:hypothetical protein
MDYIENKNVKSFKEKKANSQMNDTWKYFKLSI